MDEPMVSVIIPAHNGALWLEDCLNSVLNQTYSRIEIIAVNDGSTDATAEILARFEPHLQAIIHQEQKGIGVSRNRGLELARGELLAFIDQDDRWRRDKLEIQVRHALCHPEDVVIYSDAEEFDEQGTVHPSFLDLFPSLRQTKRIFDAIVRLAVPLMSTIVARRHFLERHHLSFSVNASGVDDVGLFLEIADRGGKFGFIDEKLAFRRLHQTNVSKCHYNRFKKRICLYQALAERIRRPEHRRALAWGLRAAHFRVAEWHWGHLELGTARESFRKAQGLDYLGLRAAGLRLASQLPRPMVYWLQKTKRLLAG